MRAACAAAGHPERAFRVIQITGTNGKTSTARLVDDLLRAEGVSSALYTSPSLISDTERIRVNGANISDTDLAVARKAVPDTLTPPTVIAGLTRNLALTEFEELTLACFLHLRDAAVDYAVLEVGMGGRWDATSAAHPAVAVITGVALDHQDFLGNTLEEIATDKSHIIKPGSSVVLAESVQAQPSVKAIFTARAESFDLRLRDVTADSYHIHSTTPFHTTFDVTSSHTTYPDLMLNAPAYQASNAATAIFAVEAALARPLNPEKVRTALAGATFPGRFELIREDPLLIFDGAHNPQAAQHLADLIEQLQLPQKPIIALGVLKDKDAAGIIAALTPQASAFLPLTPPSPRALPASALSDMIVSISGKEKVVSGNSDHSAGAKMLCRGRQTNRGREEYFSQLSPLHNMTKNQPVIITGSLTLYPLIQSFLS